MCVIILGSFDRVKIDSKTRWSVIRLNTCPKFFSLSLPILRCIRFRDRSRVRLTHGSKRFIGSHVVYVQYTLRCLRFEPITYDVYRLLFFRSSLFLSYSLAFLLSIQMVQGQMRISNFIYIVFLIYIYFILIFEFECCYF